MSTRGSKGVGAARILARRGGFVLADVLVVSLSPYFVFCLRFDGVIPQSYLATMLYSMLPVGLKIPVLMALRMYRRSWRHVGMREMLWAVLACSIGSVGLAAAFFLFREFTVFSSVPRSVVVIDAHALPHRHQCGAVGQAVSVYDGGNRTLLLRGERAR